MWEKLSAIWASYRWVTAILILGALAWAAANYRVVLSTYAEYWGHRNPLGLLDERQYKPVVILSVSRIPDGITVKLMRTYAEPGVLELTIIARLSTSEGGIALLAAKMRVPVGTIQELAFLGGTRDPVECAELTIIMDGTEAARWRGCVQG